MHPMLKRFFASPAAALLAYQMVRTYSATFRLTVKNEKPWLAHLDSGGRVVLCAWHQQFFGAIRYFGRYRPYHPSILISQSRDGSIISGVAERVGWHVVRGSSSRNAGPALSEMIGRLRENGLAANIVDGPRGPMGVVKPGVIRMAQAADAVIVPLYTAAEDAWYMNSWDRFLIPKPFARVELVFGHLFRLGPISSREDFEAERLRLENTMLPALRNASPRAG